MQSFDFKKILPHLLIIVGFAVMALFFSAPQLDGLQLNQTDIIHWKGMAKEGMVYHEKTGEQVLWSNSMFGGMPTYTYYTGKTANYNWAVQNFLGDTLGKPLAFLLVAMICFYMLMNVLKVNRWVAAIAAIAPALSSLFAQ